MNMRTPNEVIDAGLDMMFDGREPTTVEDQVKLMAFIAINTVPEAAEAVCRVMKSLYPERLNLVDDAWIPRIVASQVQARAEMN